VTAWVWIEEALALAVDERMLVLHGGAGGVRDLGLLQSALAHPRHLEAYGQDADLFQLAAGYTFGVIQNHPFIDGNKRTGFVLGVLFLELNGARFTASEAAAADAVIKLASGRLDEAAYAAFLRESVSAAR
jgi:death-on-curing protein